MLGLAYAVPELSLSLAATPVIALALAICGATMACAGIITFRQRRTTINPLTPSASSSLVSSGVYRFSRNPMYLGYLLALTGWAVYLSNVVAVLLLPAFAAYLTKFQIKPEERALLTKFGPEFAQYMSRVRQWL